MINKFSLYILLFTSFISFAQVPLFEVNSNNNFSNSHPVIIKKMGIDVTIVGQIATVKATYVFHNPSSQVLEGRATFPLPEGVSVGGYALDIEGKMRQAVVVPKEKAKEVFESISRRNVDPGILEKVEGNNFRARIYPLPANGSRTIEIFYHQELVKQLDNNQFFINFSNDFKVPAFDLNITVADNFKKPEILENPDGTLSFEANGNNWSAKLNKSNFSPTQNLKINIPLQTNKLQAVLQEKNDKNYFFAAAVSIALAEKPVKKIGKLGIIWDNSMSAVNRDLEKDFAFLDAYFKTNKNIEVNLAFINVYLEIDQTFTVIDGNWQELKNKLLLAKFDGGTDLSMLNDFKDNQAYMLFSDGVSTFGDVFSKFSKPVYTISSSPSSNFSVLNQIANSSGGKTINLNLLSIAEANKKANSESLKFLGFEGATNFSEVYPSVGSTVNENLMLYGITSNNEANAVAIFGYDSSNTVKIPIRFNASHIIKNFEIKQLWAQRKIENLELKTTDNLKEIQELGKEYSLVTSNTSMIVLEDINDYVKYDITPPVELVPQFNQLKNAKNKQIFEQRKNLLTKAFDATKELKIWWNTNFNQEEKKEVKLGRQSNKIVQKETVEEVRVNYDSSNYDDEVGFFSKDKTKKPTGSITLVDIESDAEYMSAFKTLKDPEVIYQKYLELRAKYKTNVVYYFDISKVLLKVGDKKLAFKVLSSLAELDFENEELYKTIFYTLKQRGQFDKELWITKKILNWRPFDPQSHRDYASALLNNKMPQEALDVYKQLLYREFTDEIALRDIGIEETLVMEMNNIIDKNPTVNSSKIDDRLKAKLPVDIRVVINWNKDNTDIDLWVTDPRGEECSYSNRRSKIGGRISNDFTQGFGPEQFLLKKAIPGKYIIKTNFFGENQNFKSGPTTIMAEVFLYYSDGKQERKIAVFQSKKEQKREADGKIIIGEFNF